jgi:aspartate/methionine/tyrosine aminotransferase
VTIATSSWNICKQLPPAGTVNTGKDHLRPDLSVTVMALRVGVAITPGIDFGNHCPERHVRFACTTSRENLEEGVSRLREYLCS